MMADQLIMIEYVCADSCLLYLCQDVFLSCMEMAMARLFYIWMLFPQLILLLIATTGTESV